MLVVGPLEAQPLAKRSDPRAGAALLRTMAPMEICLWRPFAGELLGAGTGVGVAAHLGKVTRMGRAVAGDCAQNLFNSLK